MITSDDVHRTYTLFPNFPLEGPAVIMYLLNMSIVLGNVGLLATQFTVGGVSWDLRPSKYSFFAACAVLIGFESS